MIHFHCWHNVRVSSGGWPLRECCHCGKEQLRHYFVIRKFHGKHKWVDK